MVLTHLEIYQDLALEANMDVEELDEIRVEITKSRSKILSADIKVLQTDFMEFARIANEVTNAKSEEIENLQHVILDNENEMENRKVTLIDIEVKTDNLEKELEQREQELVDQQSNIVQAPN